MNKKLEEGLLESGFYPEKGSIYFNNLVKYIKNLKKEKDFVDFVVLPLNEVLDDKNISFGNYKIYVKRRNLRYFKEFV